MKRPTNKTECFDRKCRYYKEVWSPVPGESWNRCMRPKGEIVYATSICSNYKISFMGRLKNLFLKREGLMNCKHEFNGFTCGKERGHDGGHSFFEETSSKANETCFTVHEWNDDGEIPIQQEEYGTSIPCNYDDGHVERKKIMSLCMLDARKTLPKGTVFEVRSKTLPKEASQDYGRIKRTRDEAAKDWGICWYFVPKVEQPKGFENYADISTAIEPLIQYDVDAGIEQELGGYILLARLEA